MIRGRLVQFGAPETPLAPFVTAEVRLDGEPAFAQVDFLIDTGADRTTLHPDDALRVWSSYLSHDFAGDASLELVRGIGGAAGFITRRATVMFFEEDGEAVSGDFTLNIAELRQDNRYLPSLLGRDVLRHVRLIVDETSDLVALELPD